MTQVTARSASEPGYVYFLRSETRVKIGFSRDPAERLKALALMSPEPVELVGLHPGLPRDERALHRRFAAHLCHSEWFLWCDEIRHVAENGFDAPGLAPAGERKGSPSPLMRRLRAALPRKTAHQLAFLTGRPLSTCQKVACGEMTESRDMLAALGRTRFAVEVVLDLTDGASDPIAVKLRAAALRLLTERQQSEGTRALQDLERRTAE